MESDKNQTTPGEVISISQNLLKSKGFEITKDLYADIALTPEETALALYEARKAKSGKIHAEDYARRLREERKYIKLDSTGTRAMALKKFKDRNNGKDFEIDKFSEPILNMLSAYFSRDKYFISLSPDYSFDKGIAMFGNIGTGKTTLMKMFSLNSLHDYLVFPCHEIANNYIKWDSANEENPIDRYCDKIKYSILTSSYNPFGHEFLGCCFDDLGTEVIPAKNYGREMNVMAEIFLSRYNKNASINFNATHFTTNLPLKPKENEPSILGKYGNRIYDRLKEMFNIIEFDTEADSRR